ncbi:MAG: oligosaccharide flippase family protein [Crocinitomicaceae bacterium]|nr:oligosaccharide flippase family protein [Crocinitomicaceae bacterium]
MESPIKRLLGQTAVYGLTVILGRALNFLLVPLYVYVFAEPKDYGVVSILYAWVAFLIVLLPLGMETAFFKFISDNKEKKEDLFQNSFLTVGLFNALFLIFAIAMSPKIAEWMLMKGHAEYIILLASIVCIDAVSALPLAKLRIENQAKRFATIQITAIAVNIFFNVVLLLFFFDKSQPEIGVLYILVANFLSSLVKPIMVYKDFMGIRFTFNKELIKTMLIYSFPLVLAGFAGIINETIDRILLQNILYNIKLDEFGDPKQAIAYAEGQVGIYSACYKLAMLVTIFLQAYKYAAEPFFFSNAQHENRNKLYIKVMNYLIALLCVVFLLVSLNLQLFKYFIPNSAYWEGLKVVPLLLLANVFLGIYYNQSIWYKLSGQTKFGAYIAIGGAALTIGMNFLLIPMIGYEASAWTTMAVYACQMIASYLLGQKYYPINYNIRKFILYFGYALLVFFILRFFAIPDGWAQFVIHNTVILLFIGSIYFIEKSTSKAL